MTKNNNLLIIVPRIVSRAGEWYQPPLGIAYISAVLKQEGFNVNNINLNDSDEDFQERLTQIIKDNDIDVVLTGGVSGQYTAIFDILSATKKIKNNIINIVGGGIITSTPKEAMLALEYADYGVIGEGEIIVCRLIQALQNEEPIEEVPGIIYKSDAQPIYLRTNKPIPIVDVKTLPFPDYEGIGFGALIKSSPNILGMSEDRTLPIMTSRGCPFKCTFCFQPDGQRYRVRDLDDVFNEIDFLIKEYDLKYLAIIDELFGAHKNRVEEFCERIKPYNIKWAANFRIPQLTLEIVKLLKESNYHTAWLGIESLDDGVLKSMKKKIKRKEIEEGLKLLYDANIGIQGILIFGDPQETKATAKNTLDWWKKNIHYDLQLSAIIAYPGTPIFDYAVDNGIIKDVVQYIKDGSPLIKLSPHMSEDDYAWLFQQILSLPRESYPTPKNSEVIAKDFQKAKLSIKGQCIHCNIENKWTDVRSFMLEAMTCKNCGRRHIAPIPNEFIEQFLKNYKTIVNYYGEIAFWGINSYFYSFMKLVCKKINKYYLVDRGESRIGVPIEGCKGCVVQSPDIIDKKEIKCLIVAVPNYYSNIKSSIENTHPSVVKIFSIVDLINKDFRLSEKSKNNSFTQPTLESRIQGKH